jgi:hypothetical protein
MMNGKSFGMKKYLQSLKNNKFLKKERINMLFKQIFAGLLLLSNIFQIISIGKNREPISPGMVAASLIVNLIVNLIIIYGLFFWS